MPSRLWIILSESYVFLKGIVRYKESLFWIVLFPLIWLTMVSVIWGSPDVPTVDLGLLVLDNKSFGGENSTTKILVDILLESEYFRVVNVSSRQELVELIKKGELTTGLVIPEGFSENLSSLKPAYVEVYYSKSTWGGFASNIVLGFLEGLSSRYRSISIDYAEKYIREYTNPLTYKYAVVYLEFIKNPIKVKSIDLTPNILLEKGGLRAIYSILMIGIEALFAGMFVGALAINERKRSGTLKIILASPMRSTDLLLADTVSGLLAVAITALVVIPYSWLVLGAEYRYFSPTAIAASIVLVGFGTLFTIGLGLLIAPLAKTPEGASALVSGIAFPVMFVGGLAVPKEILPENIKWFADYYPLSRSIDAVRRIIVHGYSTSEALIYALPAIIAALAVYLAGVLVYRKLMERVVEYY